MISTVWIQATCRGAATPAPRCGAPTKCDQRRRRRRASASGNMVATQKTAMPRYVRRQPSLWMKCCTTGGQTVPAR
jgi:hypothetical protein